MTFQNGGAKGLYLMHLSVHGLVRGTNLELGRDADTGGQVKYVIELARALAKHRTVERVDVLTRKVEGKGVDASYAQPFEELTTGARIVRISCGPKRYLKKERLWPYLDNFVDQAVHYIRSQGRVPDAIHGHYADAGYVGAQLARMFGVPFFFTGHSLGRVKQQRLLEKGVSSESLEKRFTFAARIEAEETALDTAARVIVSTHQEIEQQYALYDNYQPTRMKVIAPGVDLTRFTPPVDQLATGEGGGPGATEAAWQTNIGQSFARFLRDRDKPLILAIARPDEKKNFPTLVEAFATFGTLRKVANLAIIAGNREKLSNVAPGARRVLRNLMLLIDSYDLYGSIAYPKRHQPDDIPDAYRLAAATGGVFVNPALTEPFGLTLIEAAASGLPVVATDDGGPRDILATCENGVLVNPLDKDELGQAMLDAVTNRPRWERWAQSGLRRSHEAYSWDAHVERYLARMEEVLEVYKSGSSVFQSPGTRLPTIDRLLITNVDDTLTGDADALKQFLERLDAAGSRIGFGIASGSQLGVVLATLRDHDVPVPDFIIASAGTEIYYGKGLVPDRGWLRHIHFRWEPEKIWSAMAELPGLKPQDEAELSKFKLSYERVGDDAPTKDQVQQHLRSRGVRANVVVSFGRLVDVLPIRASTGLAIRHLMLKWGLRPEQLLAVGSTGNDEMMLSGDTLGVVVGHYSPEIRYLKGRPRIYFTAKKHAWGVLDGIDYYNFFGTITVPQDEEEAFVGSSS
ncbi:MAG: glycosyltransferase [Bdellovibrionales bacterium]|nr:glycosyltransferase [Bdellovibrionales bacterium]